MIEPPALSCSPIFKTDSKGLDTGDQELTHAMTTRLIHAL